jgi:hypothetical protein
MGIRRTGRTGVRLWRWRRNPLKRRSDVAEAWMVLAAGVLMVVGAPAVGVATGLGVEEAELRQSQDWHRVSAVLTRTAPPATESVYSDSGNGRVAATVRWTASDGSYRTGKALVEPGREAGARTLVWLDEHGVPQDDPVTPVQAQAGGMVVGASAATGTCLLVLGGRWAVRQRLDLRREAEWEREWAETGPRWGLGGRSR